MIEETFPLNCDAKDLRTFLQRSRPLAAGWIGFYWGKTPRELRPSTRPSDQLMLSWLELFQTINPNR